MIAVAAFGVAALSVFLVESHADAPHAGATHHGVVTTSPSSGLAAGTGVMIIGHKRTIPVKMTTCTTTSSTFCRLGAYQVTMGFDASKFTIQTDVGTSTGSNTSTTFKDTSKSWKANQWAGSRVVLTGGLVGGDRLVVSNTSNTLTITPAWDQGIPDATSTYTLGGLVDGGWIASTGRPTQCFGPEYGPGTAEMHCVTSGASPLGPTGSGNLVALSVQANVKGLHTFSFNQAPGSTVLAISSQTIAADWLSGTRRVIQCPDPVANNVVKASDLGTIAAAFGHRAPPATPNSLYTTVKDVDENGTINSSDLGLTASVFNKRCDQSFE